MIQRPLRATIPRQIVRAGPIPAGGRRFREMAWPFLSSWPFLDLNPLIIPGMNICLHHAARGITGQGLATEAGRLSRLRRVAECSCRATPRDVRHAPEIPR
jgi:hypothetical protein